MLKCLQKPRQTQHSTIPESIKVSEDMRAEEESEIYRPSDAF